jgi:hypothetical protein
MAGLDPAIHLRKTDECLPDPNFAAGTQLSRAFFHDLGRCAIVQQ